MIFLEKMPEYKVNILWNNIDRTDDFAFVFLRSNGLYMVLTNQSFRTSFRKDS